MGCASIHRLAMVYRTISKTIGIWLKNAATLGCTVFFGGVIAHAYTSDDSWVWNGLMFAIVPPLIQLFRGKSKKSSS